MLTEPTVATSNARATRFIGVAIATGLLLRLTFGLAYWVDKPMTHDEHEYLTLAHSLKTGLGFRYPEPPPPTLAQQRFSRAPGYPFFLAVLGEPRAAPPDFGASPRAVKIAQSVVGAIGVLLIGLLAWRTAGPTAGWIAAGIGAVYPPLVWIAGYVLTEPVYSVLSLTAVLLMTSALDERHHTKWRRLRRMGICGAVVGLGALTHPAMMTFLGIAAVWISIRCDWRLAAALVLGAVLVITPWTVRNINEHGRLVIVAASGGMNFWIGNHPLSAGDGDMAANPQVGRANAEFRRDRAGLTEAELEPLYYRAAIDNIANDPLGWIGLLLRKFFFLWIPIGPSYALHSTRYLLASVVSYGLVLPFAVAGVVRCARAGAVPVGLWLLASSTIVTSLVFFPQERFRIPVLDPTLIIFAATWLAGGARRKTPRGG